MKNLIFITFLIVATSCLAQDYLLQNYTAGGRDEIYGQRNMVVDNNGYIYATGVYKDSFEIQSSVIFSTGIYVAKFNNDLSLIWFKKIAGILNAPASFAGLRLMIDLDNQSNPIITYNASVYEYKGGQAIQYDDSTNINLNNVELIKLDSSGTRLWRTAVAGSYRLGEKGLAVDNQNNILITGKNSTDDVFLSKYDKNGTELWYKTAGVAGANKKDEGRVVATDKNNNIYTAGKLYGIGNIETAYFGTHQVALPASCYDPTYLAKYAADGTLQWVQYLYSDKYTLYDYTYGSSTITSLECFEDGTLAVGGFFTNQQLLFSKDYPLVEKNGGDVGYRASFLSRFDANGDLLWAKAVHNTANAGTDIVDLSIDDDDYIYTLSSYWGTVVNELGDTLLPNSTSSSDMILERYSADGNLRSYSKIACKHDDIAYDIATYGNSVYTFSSSSFPFYIGADIDTIPYDSLSGMRAVILRLTENPTVATNEQAQASEIAVFPNPNNGIFTVQTPVKNSKITVHTLSGKLLYETKQVNEQTTIDLRHLPSGMYLLNVRSAKFSITKKIVKE